MEAQQQHPGADETVTASEEYSSTSHTYTDTSKRRASTASSVCVISGGSACNAILDSFTSLFDECRFVLPVSDNGGSSSEIIRVLGGPSLGDIRSRLVRLIPDTRDKDGIRALFGYRLPSSDDVDSMAVKQEWLEIVEGSHRLWRNVPPDRREAIRAFLVHFEHAILRRAQRRFNFRSGSIGNFWLAGAQLFVRSLQSAIFLFSSVCGISTNYSVIPAINTNSLVTIAAELADGTRLVGQNEISHPSEPSATNDMLAGSYTPASASAWPDHGIPSTSSTPFPHQTGSSTHLAAGASGSYSGREKRRSLESHRLPHSHLVPSTPGSSQPSSRAPSRLQSYTHTPHVHSPLYAHSHTGSQEIEDDDNPSVIARTAFDLEYHQDVDEGEMSWDTNRSDAPQTGSPRKPRASKAEAGNIVFSKAEDGSWPSLSARIQRIIYLNTYGQETFPAPSSAFLSALSSSDVLVYACGSLFTSLVPPLALFGVGSAIAMSSRFRAKVLLLNSSYDRESENLTAIDFIHAVTDHLNGSIASHQHLHPAAHHHLPGRKYNHFAPGDYVTHVFYLENGSIPVDLAALAELRITGVRVAGDTFGDENLKAALQGLL